MHLFEEFILSQIILENTPLVGLHSMKQLILTAISTSMSIQIQPMINVMKSEINIMMKHFGTTRLKFRTQYPMQFADIQ